MAYDKTPKYRFDATVADQVLNNCYEIADTYTNKIDVGTDFFVENNKVTYDNKCFHFEISTPTLRKQDATVAINQRLKNLTTR